MTTHANETMWSRGLSLEVRLEVLVGLWDVGKSPSFETRGHTRKSTRYPMASKNIQLSPFQLENFKCSAPANPRDLTKCHDENKRRGDPVKSSYTVNLLHETREGSQSIEAFYIFGPCCCSVVNEALDVFVDRPCHVVHALVLGLDILGQESYRRSKLPKLP